MPPEGERVIGKRGASQTQPAPLRVRASNRTNDMNPQPRPVALSQKEVGLGVARYLACFPALPLNRAIPLLEQPATLGQGAALRSPSDHVGIAFWLLQLVRKLPRQEHISRVEFPAK